MSKSVLDLFGSLKGLIKLETVQTDNLMFRLHYKATVIVFVLSCILVTARQYIGEPIHCIAENKLPQKFVDTYCWIHPTYTLPAHYGGEDGKSKLSSGVGFEVVGEDSRVHHNYYQWVCFVLFFQSILFYVPRYLWKNWEGGLMKTLTQKINTSYITEEKKEEGLHFMLKHVASTIHKHNMYAVKFLFCEILNIVNVFVQLYLMNLFLGNQFTSYGLRVLLVTLQSTEERDDPLNTIFPKLTKCEFFKYGPSGSIQRFDNLCVLPLNIINEKVYIVIWFWCFLLAAFSLLFLVYRMITLISSGSRKLLLRSQCSYHNLHCTSVIQDIDTLVSMTNFADWFVLMQIAKNIPPTFFAEFIFDLTEKLRCKKNPTISGRNA